VQLALQHLQETVFWAILTGIALFVLRVVLSLALRKRFASGLVPTLTELDQADSTSRLFALIGQHGEAHNTLGTRRLPASLGLKLLYWGVLLAMAYVFRQMSVSWLGVETVLLAVVFCLAVHTSLYEIAFDRDTITLPRWWLGRSTRRWRDLDAMVSPPGWFLAFHFRDGTVIHAHKYVVGFAELREVANAALREV
jgi:hypothetical protein